LHAEWKRDDVDDGVGKMDEWEEDKANERPYWGEEEDDSVEEFTERPPYHVERHKENGAYVGHAEGCCPVVQVAA
jgi:hypothetical protein